MVNILSRVFFNWWYRLNPPEQVKYWRYTEAARAKVTKNDDGQLEMHIEGEKYPYPGFPRGPILLGKIGKLKHMVKTRVFNAIANDLKKLSMDLKVDMVSKDKLSPAVRHIYETFEKLEECEVVDDMKDRIRLMRDVITFLLQEDDAYRMRTQLFLYLLDQKKVKLSKADLYYLRGKYYKPDRYKKVLGKTIDAYQY